MPQPQFESLKRELTDRVRNLEYSGASVDEKTFVLLGKQILNLNEKLESQNQALIKRLEAIESSVDKPIRATRKATRS